jgi:peptidoglycan/LPS O-acetylase OafA/YrhL
MNVDVMLESPATARTSQGSDGRNAEIEVLRAVAILLVLVQHIPLNLLFWRSRINFTLLDSGCWTGVDLFFAISGFVIARPLLPVLERTQGATDFMIVAVAFWLRRAWRILPSAWLWLVLPLFLCVFFNQSSAFGSLRSNWEMLVAGLLDLANFRTAYIFGHYPSGTAFVQWSLSLEEQFYLALPVAAFVFRRWLPWPLLLIAAFGFFVPNYGMGCQARLWPVALGVLLAIWCRHPTYFVCAPDALARSRAARIAVLVMGVACLVSLGTSTFHIVGFFQGPISVVAAGLVWVASYDRGYLWQRGRARRIMEYVAARSYSLYLVHIPVYFSAHEVWVRLHGMAVPGNRPQAAVFVATGLIATFIVAEINHRLVERPLREHGKRVAARFQTRSIEDAR